MTGQFRQSVFGRLGGYDDVNDRSRQRWQGDRKTGCLDQPLGSRRSFWPPTRTRKPWPTSTECGSTGFMTAPTIILDMERQPDPQEGCRSPLSPPAVALACPGTGTIASRTSSRATSTRSACQGFFRKAPSSRAPSNHVRRYYASFSYRAGSWDRKRRSPRWNGTPANWFPVSASSSLSPARPSAWSPSTISAVRRSSTSRKARTPSDGPGCHAGSSATTRSGCSFTPWPTISVTSCGHWPCRRRWSTGRTTLREKLVKIGAKVVTMAAMSRSNWRRWLTRDLFRKSYLIDDLRPRPAPA